MYNALLPNMASVEYLLIASNNKSVFVQKTALRLFQTALERNSFSNYHFNKVSLKLHFTSRIWKIHFLKERKIYNGQKLRKREMY